MHHFVVVKEGDQHHFHLRLLHAGLLGSWRRQTTDDFVASSQGHIEKSHLLMTFPRVCRRLSAAEGCLGTHSLDEVFAPESRASLPQILHNKFFSTGNL